MDIADRIKLLRGEQSREQFIDGTDTSAQSLYKYEKRSGKPSVEFVYKICKKFNISYAWLIAGEGNMHLSEACPVAATETCQRCIKLEMKVDALEEERRELSTELREVNAENRRLAKENTELIKENATLRERQRKEHPSLFDESQPPIVSNETAQLHLSR